MHKLIAIYRRPGDVEAFEAHYRDVHMPLVRKLPGLREGRLNRVTGAPGGRSGLHLVAELCFGSRGDLEAAMASRENREAGKDLMSFAGDLVEVHFAEEARG